MRGTSKRAGAVAVVAGMLAGCGAFSDVGNINLLPRVDQLSRPDWLTYSGGKNEFTLRAVTAADLVSQDGGCAASTAQPAGGPDDGGDGAQLASGGIALQMTECDVVRRGGQPDQIEIGADERGERATVITYLRGPRPGVYRFAGGRLVAIERAPNAPAERPQKGKAKKAARS